MSPGGGERGQSTVIGVVLLLGLTVASISVIVGVGASAIDASTGQMELGSAQNAMMEFDSRMSLVAHGGSQTQAVSLPQDDESSVTVEESAGWINITIVNQSTGELKSVIANETMGAVVYTKDGTQIAYQNGGVWKYRDGGSVMVSPPEVHYRGTTLTLPMVRVQRGSDLSGNPVIEETGSSSSLYPIPGHTNPLEDGQVNVTVHSKYYEGWADYFEKRTSGQVEVDHENQTATLELVVVANPGGFRHVVATSQPGGITVNGNDPPPSPYDTGVSFQPSDSKIEERIDDCQTNPGTCNSSPTSTLTAGNPYYIDSDYSASHTFDTTGGNVTLIVNGDYDPGTVDIVGDNNTVVYVREDFEIDADLVNDGGNPGEYSVGVHSDGDVDFSGNYKFVGLAYAPGSDCDLNGGGSNSPNLVGGVVCETMDVNGNPNDFQYDDSIQDSDLNLGSKTTVYITYLHLSRTNVTVGA